MDKSLVIGLLIIAGLLIFVLGGGLGVFYQTQKDTLSVETASKAVVEAKTETDALTKTLTSKALSSITGSGQVTDIAGRNITLSSGGDSITFNLLGNAQILSFVADSTGKMTQQKVDFSQIKKGDNLSVNLKLLPDGTLEGQAVMILPLLGTSAAK